MAIKLNISRIEGDPKYILQNWQVLDVLPTGPCHSPASGPRYLIFAGCIDRSGVLHRTGEIVSLDPTRRLGIALDGTIYQLGRIHGFSKTMVSRARCGFWAYSHKPRDLTAQVLPMLCSLNAHAGSEIEYLE